ncbi:cytochrome c biogenesis protein, partial [bacterium]|nr:cytochrome c biogenesis protein [bacterium]
TWFILFEFFRGRLPLANPAEGFGTVALSITLVYALLELISRERALGFPLLLAASLLRIVASLSPDNIESVSKLLHEPWFGFHAMSAILGYTGFTVSAVYAIVFLFLYANLKRRRFGVAFERMPSLDLLARSSIRAATLGFVFLTAAIVAGAFGWARILEGPAWQDPKVLSVMLAWVVYGISVALWYAGRWRGIRAIGLTLVAFLLMVLSSWLVPWVLGSSHGAKGLL